MDWKKWKQILKEQKIYSFDYDNTLVTYKASKDGDHGVFDKEHEANVALVRKLVEEGNKVIIVTSRKQLDKRLPWDTSPSPEQLVEDLALPISEIHYTNGQHKAETLLQLGVSEHWDDDPDEIDAIQRLNNEEGSNIVAHSVPVSEDIFEALHKMWANKLREHGYPVPDKMKKYLTEGVGTKTLTGTSVQQTLDILDGYGDNTWIFFDTESTGFDQNKDQVTELAAVAVRPNGWVDPEIVGTYHEKIKLNPDILRRLKDPESPERKDWEKGQAKAYKRLEKPQDVLSMTRYGQKGIEFQDEQKVLEDFKEFILDHPNPILVAQNASHDMKFVNGRIKEKLPRVPVVDTVPLLKFQLIPFLQSLTDIGNIEKNLDIPGMSDEERVEFKKIFSKAQFILDTISGRGGPSASLGKVATAFQIDAKEWHNALADTKMLMSVYQETFNMLKLIEKYQVKTFLRHVAAVNRDRSLKRFLASKNKPKKKVKEEKDYQQKMREKHPRWKQRLTRGGEVKDKSTPYKIKLSLKRGKSAPPGAGG